MISLEKCTRPEKINRLKEESLTVYPVYQQELRSHLTEAHAGTIQDNWNGCQQAITETAENIFEVQERTGRSPQKTLQKNIER